MLQTVPRTESLPKKPGEPAFSVAEGKPVPIRACILGQMWEMEAHRRIEKVLAQEPGSQAVPKDKHLQQIWIVDVGDWAVRWKVVMYTRSGWILLHLSCWVLWVLHKYYLPIDKLIAKLRCIRGNLRSTNARPQGGGVAKCGSNHSWMGHSQTSMLPERNWIGKRILRGKCRGELTWTGGAGLTSPFPPLLEWPLKVPGGTERGRSE